MANEWLSSALLQTRGRPLGSAPAEEPPAVDDTAVARLERARDGAAQAGDAEAVALANARIARLTDETSEPRPKVDFSSGVRRPIRRELPPNEKMNALIRERWRPTVLGRRV
jgi:hypothetical protein